jgi:predicted MFS family arabinose efflux permease
MSIDANRPSALPSRLLGRVFLPFAVGYYASYFFRTVNAVISPDLVRDLGVDANRLGLLTSAYLLGFAVAQLPLGLALDRFGPRRVNAVLLVLAALGAVVFALSDSLAGLVSGRALIGLGVSGALMASIKAFTLWFPMNRLATLNGWLLAFGGLGAISASAPVEALLAYTSWRGLFAGMAAVTLAAAIGVFALVPERAADAERPPLGAMIAAFATIFRDGGFWRIAGVVMTGQGAFLATQGLWAAPWLRDVAGFDRAGVARMLLAMAIATTCGFAASGVVSDALARRGISSMTILKAGALLNALCMLSFALGLAGAAVLAWIVFAVLASVSALAYAILANRFDRALAGRASTALNLLVFVGAFATQWGIGAIVGLWPAEGGRYPVLAYQAGFGTFVAGQLVALAFFLRWRDVSRS